MRNNLNKEISRISCQSGSFLHYDLFPLKILLKHFVENIYNVIPFYNKIEHNKMEVNY